jgi:hypothetical protein
MNGGGVSSGFLECRRHNWDLRHAGSGPPIAQMTTMVSQETRAGDTPNVCRVTSVNAQHAPSGEAAEAAVAPLIEMSPDLPGPARPVRPTLNTP